MYLCSISAKRRAASSKASDGAGSNLLNRIFSATCRRASANDPKRPAAIACTSALPITVASTGPASTGIHSHRQLPGLDNCSGCHHRQFARPQFFCSSDIRSRAELRHIAKPTSQGPVWLLPKALPACSRVFPRVVRRSLAAYFADSIGGDRRERLMGQPVRVSRLRPTDYRTQLLIPAAPIL